MEGDPVAEPEADGLLAPGRLGVAPAVDVEADVQGRTGGAQPGDRAEDGVDLVDRCQRPGVHEPDRAVGLERAARVGARIEPHDRGRVADDVDLVARDAQPDEPVRHRGIDGHDGGGDRDRCPLLDEEGLVGERVRRAREPAPEELRHRLVQVEQERDTGEPQRERREREEIRQAVDLDEPVPPAAVGAGELPAGPDSERDVLAEIGPDPGALVALHVQPPDANPVDDPVGRIVAASEGEHVDLATGRDERLRLAPNARILVVVRVNDHRDRCPVAAAARGVQTPLQPAPSRSTWRDRVARPAELLTVSTTRSASR